MQDPLGRTTTLTYDAAGNRTAMAYPNATSTTYGYDARNRLLHETTQTTGSSPVTIQSYVYTLDLAGRRTEVSEAEGTVRSYGYDSIDRLTSETVTGSLTYGKTFEYDGVGNRLTQTTTGAGAATVNYAYDERDRLTTENATDYAYDANGNVTSKSGEATYGWDFENRLTSVHMTGGATVAHEYDVDGNRVQTSVTLGGSAVTTNMLVDTAGCASCGGGGLSQVVAETAGSGNITAFYVRAGDELLEGIRPGSTAGTWTTGFVHHDGIGSVRALTDETGTITDTRAYEAFGTKNVEAGNDPLTYGFAGEPFQADSMLAYHRARWMDARVGGFLGMDPKNGDTKYPATGHRYVYALNEPTGVVDPSGEDGVDALPNYVAAFVGPPLTNGQVGVVLPGSSLGGRIINMGCQNTPTGTCSTIVLDRQLAAAFQYISLSPTGLSLLNGLPTVEVTQVVGGNDTGQVIGSIGFVNWDPFAAFQSTTVAMVAQGPIIQRTVTYGPAFSPALALVHELAHTLGEDEQHADTYWLDNVAEDLDNLGFDEWARPYYAASGTYVKVSGATSTTPIGSVP